MTTEGRGEAPPTPSLQPPAALRTAGSEEKTRRPRSWLALRVFAVTAVLVAVVVAAAMALALWLGRRGAEQAARDALDQAAAVQEAMNRRTLETLRLMARVFVADPALVAYLARTREEGDRISMLDLLEERRDDLGFDFAIVLDEDGRVVARTDAPDASGDDLSAEPIVARALDDYGGAGIWRLDGALYNVVVEPIVARFLIDGYLVIGFAVDEASLLELRRVSRADRVILLPDGADLEVGATTLAPGPTTELLDQLRYRPQEEASGEPFDVELGGQRWSATMRNLGDPVVARSVSLAALEPQMQPFRTLARLLLLGGLLAIGLAAGALFFLVTRALSPLARLAEMARRAAHGEYDQSVGSVRRDEVGELARAFDRLLSDLRERRDTEAYLAQVAWSLPTDEGGGSRRQGEPSGELSTVEVDEAGTGAAPTLTAPTTDRARMPAGSVLGGRFEILEVLGAGGMGVVYKAHDRSVDEIVALKTLRKEHDDPKWLSRLKEELRLARRVTHRNVLRTYDLGELDGTTFLTMEYVRGITLRYLLRESGRPPYSAGLRLARELCRGLQAAHEIGVLHRDIKPENLLIEPNGHAKLADFGIARPVRVKEPREGSIVGLAGTAGYMAPELFSGIEPSVRSDIYSCGVVLYELFTAAKPFLDGAAAATAPEGDPVPPQRYWEAMPARLEALILSMLERQPEARPASAREVLEILEPLRA